VDKLSHHLRIRLTEEEHHRLQQVAFKVKGDCSSVVRLALKRMFRDPPVRQFRYRPRRGAKI
jgi:hypothetical protein